MHCTSLHWTCLVVATLIGLTTAQAEPALSFLNTVEIKHDDITPFRKWTGVMERHHVSVSGPSAKCSRDNEDACKLRRAFDFFDSLAKRNESEQLDSLNRYINQSPYVRDVDDHWETLEEFILFSGDCEDYAIAKYFALRRLGWPADRLRLVVTQDTVTGGAHALTVAFIGNEAMVLDNQIKDVTPASALDRYRPYYSINEEHWWLHSWPTGSPAVAANPRQQTAAR
jgi:predicted transglutaminase-like cysteine proteinase